MLDDVERGYDQVFPKEAADDVFFKELDKAWLEFHRRTKVRPIEPPKIKTAQRIFRDAAREIMRTAKARLRA